MNIPDMPVNVPVDDPNADTEWNDILRQHKIIPEKPPSPTPMIEEALSQARALAHENRLEGKDLDELDELEDLEDDEFLELYRQKRLDEMNAAAQRGVFGRVVPIQKPEYAKEVTEASQAATVLVMLSSSSAAGGGNTENRVLADVWRQAAEKWADVKFCAIQGNMCIENYPDKNCPTILVYREGDLRRQIVTLRELNGVRTSLDDIDRLLVDVGAVKEGDFRLRRRGEDDDEEGKGGGNARSSIKIGRPTTMADEDDEDWN